MKKNLIIYSVSFLLIMAALIMTSFAWMSMTKRSTADSSNISVESSSCEFALELYDSETKTWSSQENMVLNDIWPGDVFYFRFKVNSYSENDVHVNGYIEEIETTIISDLKIVGKEMIYNDVVVYDINDDGQVLLDSGDVLYTIDENNNVTISEDYKIEKAMGIYAIGVQDIDYEPTIEGLSYSNIYSNIFGDDGTLVSKGQSYVYFAIEYLDVSDNSCYAYQNLHIASVEIYVY